jgi:LPXTG-motif cell wall-anchored protein
VTLVARSLLALAAVLLVLAPGAPAWAHNALAEASPAKNATVENAPSEVRLRFLQKLDPDYTTITVSDAGKAKVATSAPKVDGATGVVTVDTPLANGAYTVAYQVVSTDGHTVKGSYQFTVEDPDAPAAPAPAASSPAVSPSPAASAPAAPAATGTTGPPALSSTSGESSGSTFLGVVVGIVVALAAGAGYLFIRRRKA